MTDMSNDAERALSERRNFLKLTGSGAFTAAMIVGAAGTLSSGAAVPSVGALFVFGFKDILSHVIFTQAVPDSQMYSCNLEWFNSLPAEVQEGIEFASEITAQQNLAKVPAARAYAMSELAKSGVEFHTLTDDQLAVWKEAGGYQRSEWDQYKTDLAGSMDAFTQLEEGASTMGRYYVHDA